MDKSLLPNIFEFISKTYPFSQLNEMQKDALATKIKISYYSKDDVLKDQDLAGTGLFMIRTGVVEERNKSDHSLRAKLTDGDTFGFTQINLEKESDYEVVFIENTLIYLIPKNILQFFISANSEVGKYFDSKEWIRLSSSHNYADDSSDSKKHVRLVADVCNTDIAVVSLNTSICDTAICLGEHDTDLAVVKDGEELVGVVTKSDITLKAVAKKLDVTEPVKNIISEKVLSVDAGRTVYDALEIMVMNSIKNLPVLKDGKIYGCVSTNSLLQNSQLQAVYLCQEIKHAKTIERLIFLSRQKREVFETLVQMNVKPHTIQKVMSHIADSFCKALVKMAVRNQGPAPMTFAFVAAGSQARREVQFLSDQDNCIITKDEMDDKAQEYFKALANFVNTNLDKCGYPLCDGNFMASNDRFRCSISTWKEYYSKWILNTDNDAILCSSVFLDMRCLYGDEELVTILREHLVTVAKDNSRFLATLSSVSTTVVPPLGTFRQFVLMKDGNNNPYLNIKKQGINLIIEIARIYGIAAQSLSTDTYERLSAAVKNSLIKDDDYKEIAEAYTFLNKVRFNHQLRSLEKGQELTNNINPEELTQFERNHLRDAFR
ncbi:MAG: DUF294 nucleotidyltransferase-like domain-containing protein, partial [Succinivibrio sp.]